jgi:hypothetical protein
MVYDLTARGVVRQLAGALLAESEEVDRERRL